MKKKVIILISLLMLWQISVFAYANSVRRLSPTSADWSLLINLENFTDQNYPDPSGGDRYVLAAREDEGVTVSVFIERFDKKMSPAACRSFYEKKTADAPMKRTNLKSYKKSNMAFFEYDVKTHNGQDVDFHSLNVFLSRENYCIDVHISKNPYNKNRKLFDAIVDSLKIE